MKRKNRKLVLKKPQYKKPAEVQVAVYQPTKQPTKQPTTGEQAMRNSLEPRILQRIIEKPAYLDKLAAQRGNHGKYLKIAETIKVIESTKCMSWDTQEFAQEFGVAAKNGEAPDIKKAIVAMRVGLTKAGIKKPRVVLDSDVNQVFVFRNDKD